MWSKLNKGSEPPALGVQGGELMAGGGGLPETEPGLIINTSCYTLLLDCFLSPLSGSNVAGSCSQR